ncbi:hypothetical protein ACPA9J_01525 [Pseudomonas aeruginosa]
MSDEDDIHEPEHDHLLDNDYLEDERDEDTFGALDEPDTCGTGKATFLRILRRGPGASR